MEQDLRKDKAGLAAAKGCPEPAYWVVGHRFFADALYEWFRWAASADM